MADQQLPTLRAELEAKTAECEALVAKIESLGGAEEAVPGGSSLARMASVAKYDGLLRTELSEEDRAIVQRVRDLRDGGTNVADFSAEDRAAWQQLDAQWQELQISDETIALTMAEMDEQEDAPPERSSGATEVAAEGLHRQVSVAKYDSLLSNPQLPGDRRAQVLAMREKRLARELGSFTEDERAEWDYLERLSQQMAEADESIARVLDEEAGAEDVEPSAVEGVTADMISEHEQAAEQREAEDADAAVAAVVEQETAADAAANTEEIVRPSLRICS